MMIIYVYINEQCNHEAHLIVSIVVDLRNYILFPKKCQNFSSMFRHKPSKFPINVCFEEIM